MTEAKTELQEPVELRYEATSKTNIYHVEVLFSIKKRKFVKPVLMKHLKLWYKVLQGTYIKIMSEGRRRAAEYRIVISLVKLEKDERWGVREDMINAAAVFVSSDKDKNDFSKVNNNELIRDIVNVIPPPYHGYPAIDFNKIYKEEDVQYILDLISNNKSIVLFEVEG